jgi:hypothetical protein
MYEMKWSFEDLQKMDGWQLHYALEGLTKLKKEEERALRRARRRRV